ERPKTVPLAAKYLKMHPLSSNTTTTTTILLLLLFLTTTLTHASPHSTPSENHTPKRLARNGSPRTPAAERPDAGNNGILVFFPRLDEGGLGNNRNEGKKKTRGVWVDHGNEVRWVPEARTGKEGVERRSGDEEEGEVEGKTYGKTHGVWVETGNGVRWVPEARREMEKVERRSYDGRGIEEMGDDELEEMLWGRW
ncbi:MAG: hypothetical protein Q9173_006816, partial [Seirophora scorigena]